MPACCVVGCSARPDDKIPELRFHHFPGRPWELEARKLWITAVKRTNPDGLPWKPSKTSVICSKHFVGGVRSQNPNHPGFVPSIFPEVYRRNSSDEHVKTKADRFNRSSSTGKITCSAPNCSNSRDGYTLFVFPSKQESKTAWLKNSNLAQRSTDRPLYLCEVHFENDQFRKHRKTKVLKHDAIPTIFNIDSQQSQDHTTTPDPYSTARQYSPIDLIETNSAEGSAPASPASHTPDIEERSTSDLLEEIAHLKNQLKKMEQMLNTFLTDEQIQALGNIQQELDEEKFTWSPESIAQGLKFQFNLGTHGYNFLRSTNYPLPAIETLNAMLGKTVISFGVFEDLSELLQYKVQALDPLDRLCTVSLDEMKFSDMNELGRNKQHLITRNFNSHDTETGGNYVTVVLIRGLRSSWEQVIACETTAPATEGISQRTLLEKSISFAEECGLRVLSFSSNLSASSRLVWSAYGVDVTKSETERVTHFSFNNHDIHVVPDVGHLLMALKGAVSTGIRLSQSLVDSEALPSIHVSSEYVKQLWKFEIDKQPAARLLHHLKERDVELGANDQISLESAVQFFSVETARALESAVMSKTINPDALSTAYFCRLVDRWFSICDSKAPEDGIAIDNKQTMFDFLGRFIEICQRIKIDDGWSPINAGMIMSTMSLCEVVNILLQQEGFGVVLLHRFSQDAVEDVISKMSGVSASTPTVFSVQCLNILKTITISQLVSEVDRSCYSIPSMNSWIENNTSSSHPSSSHETTECDVRKRKRKVSGTPKRSGKNDRVGRSPKTKKNTSKATKGKPQKRKLKMSKSTPKCELKPRRKNSKKMKK